MNSRIEWRIQARMWKHKETGEVSESVNIMEMDKYEEVTEIPEGFVVLEEEK